jgi:hypothetical protein
MPAGQCAAHAQPDQRHPALEDHEQGGDAQPFPRCGLPHGPERGGHGEGIQAQREDEGQQLQHLLRLSPSA